MINLELWNQKGRRSHISNPRRSSISRNPLPNINSAISRTVRSMRLRSQSVRPKSNRPTPARPSAPLPPPHVPGEKTNRAMHLTLVTARNGALPIRVALQVVVALVNKRQVHAKILVVLWRFALAIGG